MPKHPLPPSQLTITQCDMNTNRRKEEMNAVNHEVHMFEHLLGYNPQLEESSKPSRNDCVRCGQIKHNASSSDDGNFEFETIYPRK